MAVKKVRINCGECSTRFIIPINEIHLHVYDKGGDSVVLCQKCCKKQYWYEKGRCEYCSEKDSCNTSLLDTLRGQIDRVKGI